MAILVKARGVIIKDNKVLLLKDARMEKYLLPGGTQEEGETIQECFYREMKEELGVDAQMGKLVMVREFINRQGHSSVEFLFRVTNVEDFLDVRQENCSHGHEWSEVGFFDPDVLPTQMLRPENMKDIINDIINDRNKLQLLDIKDI